LVFSKRHRFDLGLSLDTIIEVAGILRAFFQYKRYHTLLRFPSVGGNSKIGNRLLRIRILALPIATLM